MLCAFASSTQSQLLLAAPLLCVAWACSGTDNDKSEATGNMALVDPSVWKLMDDAEDPFASERPMGVTCDSLGYSPEEYENELAFFVDTEACDYATFEQPSLVDVAEGDKLRLRFYHYALTAPEPAEGRVVLLLEEEPLFDETFAIPADAELIDRELTAPSALAKGAPIRYHVQNHGDNDWVLIEVSLKK